MTASPNLQVLCVGTGRDGTQTLAHLVQYVFDRTGGGYAEHEYCCRELNHTFCEWRETGDPAHRANMERMVAACTSQCVVGNGYAAILPLFAAQHGRKLRLLHLRRGDRTACIASLRKNCQMFPAAYGYYSSHPSAKIKRLAAFHFDGMSQASWDRLSLDDKFGWYYDRTHTLISDSRAFFDEYIEVYTEDLNSPSTRRMISRFVSGPDAPVPPAARLNASVIDIATLPQQQRHRMHWLMGRLNLEEVAADDVYALGYFVDKFVAWTGYQVNDAPQLAPSVKPDDEIIEANLERGLTIMKKAIGDLEGLRKVFRARKR